MLCPDVDTKCHWTTAASKHQGCYRNGKPVCEQVIPLPLPAQTLHPVLISCPILILCGTLSVEQSPGPSPGFPQLEMCRTGGCTVASLIMVHYLCTSIHTLGQHLISGLPPVLSCGGYTGGKILNTIRPILGNFSRSRLSDFRVF